MIGNIRPQMNGSQEATGDNDHIVKIRVPREEYGFVWKGVTICTVIIIDRSAWIVHFCTFRTLKLDESVRSGRAHGSG